MNKEHNNNTAKDTLSDGLPDIKGNQKLNLGEANQPGLEFGDQILNLMMPLQI